jgi:glycosyltransferase involved in cell wall biosynthesis
MSLSLLEAMAAGLPVVTARTAGGAEIITPECGIVLDDPDDPQALADAVGRLAGDDDRRRAMGAAASELATGFGWARMAAQYIALYRQIAGLREDRSRNGASDAEVVTANLLAAPPRGADGA